MLRDGSMRRSGSMHQKSWARSPRQRVSETCVFSSEEVLFVKNFAVGVATAMENYAELRKVEHTLDSNGIFTPVGSATSTPLVTLFHTAEGDSKRFSSANTSTTTLDVNEKDSPSQQNRPANLRISHPNNTPEGQRHSSDPTVTGTVVAAFDAAMKSILDDLAQLPIKELFTLLGMDISKKDKFSSTVPTAAPTPNHASIKTNAALFSVDTTGQLASFDLSKPIMDSLMGSTSSSHINDGSDNKQSKPMRNKSVKIIGESAETFSGYALLQQPASPEKELSPFDTDLLSDNDDAVDEGPLRHKQSSDLEWRKRKSVFFTDTLVKDRADDGLKTINNYTILDELGRGSFGKVKLAAVGDSNDMRAIKIIPKRLLRAKYRFDDMMQQDGGGEKEVGRFHKEVAIMKKLKHRNIVRLYEVIDDPHSEKLYMVLQYVERGPILNLDGDGRCIALDIDVAKGYMKQIANAVAYLHSVKICHRDIKPDNILLGANGLPYLSDFGVSSMLDSDEASEVPGQTAGTPAFLAPEEFTSEVSITQMSNPLALDIWALGVTFYCMIFGVMPFHPGGSYLEISERVRTQEVEYPVPSNGCDTSFVETSFDGDHSVSNASFSTTGTGYLSAHSSAGGEFGASMLGLPSSTKQQEAVVDLLQCMLERDMAKRYTIQQVRKHPFFTGKSLTRYQLQRDGGTKNTPLETIEASAHRTHRAASLQLLQEGIDHDVPMISFGLSPNQKPMPPPAEDTKHRECEGSLNNISLLSPLAHDVCQHEASNPGQVVGVTAGSISSQNTSSLLTNLTTTTVSSHDTFRTEMESLISSTQQPRAPSHERPQSCSPAQRGGAPNDPPGHPGVTPFELPVPRRTNTTGQTAWRRHSLSRGGGKDEDGKEGTNGGETPATVSLDEVGLSSQPRDGSEIHHLAGPSLTPKKLMAASCSTHSGNNTGLHSSQLDESCSDVEYNEGDHHHHHHHHEQEGPQASAGHVRPPPPLPRNEGGGLSPTRRHLRQSHRHQAKEVSLTSTDFETAVSSVNVVERYDFTRPRLAQRVSWIQSLGGGASPRHGDRGVEQGQDM